MAIDIPSAQELEKYRQLKADVPDEELAVLTLYSSVLGYGDFARYIIGTNSSGFQWSSRWLRDPKQPTTKEICEAFVESLTPGQRKQWDLYQTVRARVNMLGLYNVFNEDQLLEFFPPEFNKEELTAAIDKAEHEMRKQLGQGKLRILEEHVLPHLNDPNRHIDENPFDIGMAQRFIFNKVLELGWTTELFGRFDRSVNRHHTRESGKPERIGKKYQWIAYHEFLARISDNFEFKGDTWDTSSKAGYLGPWQLIVGRDIDPSCLFRKIGVQRSDAHPAGVVDGKVGALGAVAYRFITVRSEPGG